MLTATCARRLPGAWSTPAACCATWLSAGQVSTRSTSDISSRLTVLPRRSPMRREGSPFTGLSTVALKEAADHMTSARMHLVILLVLLTAVGAIYGAIGQIKETIGQDPFLFLRL